MSTISNWLVVRLHGSLGLGACLAGVLAPTLAFATILIDNPVVGKAWDASGAPVLALVAPVAGWAPFYCGGASAGFFPVHEEIDLVQPEGVDMPQGTFCRVDIVLEGTVKVVTGAATDYLDPGVIHLVGSTSGSGYKLQVEGDSGSLVGLVAE